MMEGRRRRGKRSTPRPRLRSAAAAATLALARAAPLDKHTREHAPAPPPSPPRALRAPHTLNYPPQIYSFFWIFLLEYHYSRISVCSSVFYFEISVCYSEISVYYSEILVYNSEISVYYSAISGLITRILWSVALLTWRSKRNEAREWDGAMCVRESGNEWRVTWLDVWRYKTTHDSLTFKMTAFNGLFCASIFNYWS